MELRCEVKRWSLRGGVERRREVELRGGVNLAAGGGVHQDV